MSTIFHGVSVAGVLVAFVIAGAIVYVEERKARPKGLGGNRWATYSRHGVSGPARKQGADEQAK
jgi:hypothetical protein